MILENYLIIGYFCIIIVLQSIIGVGVLVLGTPFLLILNFDIVEIFFILLPISMLTSLINLIIIFYKNKSLEKSSYQEFKKFFLICIPSIFLGLILLNFFESYINFKKLVSFIILFSLISVMLKDKIKFKINFFRKSVLSVIGVIHGLTNSGGTLMTIAIYNNKEKEYARLNTTFFYLVLATFHYFLTIFIFSDRFFFPSDLKIIAVLVLGTLIGNILVNHINDKLYKIIVSLLSFLSAIILLIS